MRKGIVALVITLIVLAPLVYTITEVGQTKNYVTENTYKEIYFDKQSKYTSAIDTNELFNSGAKILIVIAAIVVLLLTLVEYVKFYKIYREER